MEIDLEVKGLAELEQKLLKLSADVGEKTLNSALMAAAHPVWKAAKNRAPGSISEAIKRKKIRSEKTRKITIRGIGADGRSAAGVSIIVLHKKAPHAHLLEFGTDPRYTTGKGKSKSGGKKKYRAGAFRGKGPRILFMTNAWEAHGGKNSLNIFQKILTRKIKKLERL